MNLLKEYVIYLLPGVLAFLLYTSLTDLSYQYGFGFSWALRNSKYKILTHTVIMIISQCVFFFLLEYLVSLGLDPLTGDFIYYIAAFIFALPLIVRFQNWLTKTTKPYLSIQKETNADLAHKQNVIDLMIGLGIPIMMGVVMLYYIGSMIILYRDSSVTMKILISLVIHPFVIENLLTMVKLEFGRSKSIHPFFEHELTFMFEGNIMKCVLQPINYLIILF